MAEIPEQQWQDFKARMAESGVSTSYAARAILVQDFLAQEKEKTNDNDDPAEASTRMNRRRSISLTANDLNDHADDQRNIMGLTSQCLEDPAPELQGRTAKRRDSACSTQHAKSKRRGSCSSMNSSLHRSMNVLSTMESSFRFINFSEPTADEKRKKVKKREHAERRRGFDSMVNGVVGDAKPLRRRKGHRSRKRKDSHKSASRCELQDSQQALVVAPPQIDSIVAEYTVKQEEMSSFSLRNMFSALRSPFGDNRPSTTPLVVEIETDGKIKIFAESTGDDILVDFPSTPRRRMSQKTDTWVAEDAPERDANFANKDQRRTSTGTGGNFNLAFESRTHGNLRLGYADGFDGDSDPCSSSYSGSSYSYSDSDYSTDSDDDSCIEGDDTFVEKPFVSEESTTLEVDDNSGFYYCEGADEDDFNRPSLGHILSLRQQCQEIKL